MKKSRYLVLLVITSIIVLIAGIGIGSVSIHPLDTLKVIIDNMLGFQISANVNEVTQSILMNIRLPRALLAFISGSGLAISGVIMQSVLRNPLASSYTLGVSSGSALGASIAIIFGISFLGFLTIPFFGLVAGVITVFLALGVASKIDRSLQNNSIILTGMAFSLFANAMITIIMSLSADQLQRLVFWQMGSFSMKTPEHPLVLFPVVIGIGLIIMLQWKKMDILTLGEEQAKTTGVNVKVLKRFLLSLGAILTGSIISLVGIIGFVDLFTPHVARKIFGASHKYVIPGAALLGGIFMVSCDLIARTILSPVELPVGAITAIIGAPFFIYLYFSKRKINND